MSHISKIELVIHSLRDLKEACRQLGFEFMVNQKSFKWYGRWVGDTPIPEGINIEDIGKCDHAIRLLDVNMKSVSFGVGIITSFYGTIIMLEVLNQRLVLTPVYSNRHILLPGSEKRLARKDIESEKKRSIKVSGWF